MNFQVVQEAYGVKKEGRISRWKVCYPGLALPVRAQYCGYCRQLPSIPLTAPAWSHPRHNWPEESSRLLSGCSQPIQTTSVCSSTSQLSCKPVFLYLRINQEVSVAHMMWQRERATRKRLTKKNCKSKNGQKEERWIRTGIVLSKEMIFQHDCIEKVGGLRMESWCKILICLFCIKTKS